MRVLPLQGGRGARVGLFGGRGGSPWPRHPRRLPRGSLGSAGRQGGAGSRPGESSKPSLSQVFNEGVLLPVVLIREPKDQGLSGKRNFCDYFVRKMNYSVYAEGQLLFPYECIEKVMD